MFFFVLYLLLVIHRKLFLAYCKIVSEIYQHQKLSAGQQLSNHSTVLQLPSDPLSLRQRMKDSE